MGGLSLSTNGTNETLKHIGLASGDEVREVMYVTEIAASCRRTRSERAFVAAAPYPASTAVQLKRMVLPEVMVEIEITAALPA